MADYSMMAGGPIGLLPAEEEPQGLLGRLGRVLNDPAKVRGLTQMGLSLMDAAGPRPLAQRMNSGQMLARGIAGFSQGADQFRQQELERQIAAMKMMKAGATGGPFGDSMQARAWDIILRADNDPSLKASPEYAAAVAIIERPTIMQGPEGAIDMTQRLPDRFGRPGSVPVQSQVTPQGAASTQSQQLPQQQRPAVIPGTEKLSVDQKEYDKAFESLAGLQREFDDYRSALQDYGVQYGIGGQGLASKGEYSPENEQKLMSRHKSLQLSLKSPELFSLGVLAGPDMDILDGFLPSPTQVRTLIKDGGINAAEARIRTGYNEAARFINNKIEAYNSRWKGAPIKTKELPRLEYMPESGGNAGGDMTPAQRQRLEQLRSQQR